MRSSKKDSIKSQREIKATEHVVESEKGALESAREDVNSSLMSETEMLTHAILNKQEVPLIPVLPQHAMSLLAPVLTNKYRDP